MRDYKHIDGYLDSLLGDIYAQPQDEGHTALAQEVIDLWISRLTGCKSVLDVGCGEGFCQPMFEKWNVEYTGVAIGPDVLKAQAQNRHVLKMDFNFLDFPDQSFDLVFSRHSLEHSPMPLLTLMEWRRVSKNWLGLVVPAPEHYTFKGQNHYSVMTFQQVEAILPRAGWKVLWMDTHSQDFTTNLGTTSEVSEYWAFCEKA